MSESSGKRKKREGDVNATMLRFQNHKVDNWESKKFSRRKMERKYQNVAKNDSPAYEE